jgi:hypothetical protein
MYMSQDDDDDDVTGFVAPVNVNNDLPRTYPVSRDPSLANRDCEVEIAVYRNATGTCKDSDGNVLTGEEGRCGVGTAVKTLVTSGPGASAGFIPASGTGTCSLLESSGPCEVPCAQDCVGGEWVLGETCVRLDKDGNELVLYDGGNLEDGTCGPGQYTDVRNTSEATGFVPPKGRFGACEYTRTRPCNKTCVDENGNTVDAEFVGFCGYSGIEDTNEEIGSQILGHYGCVKKDRYNRPVKDQDGNYVEVGFGEQGVKQKYKVAVYGDTTKCENLVRWVACEGPPEKTDCKGEWIIQRPDAESDKEWSPCKLKEDAKHGRTWRQKEYQITTPQGELTRDGVTIPWGKPCMADVVIDGVMNTLEMKPGGQLIFPELCSTAQSVEECNKSQWKLDRERGQHCDRYDENCDGCELNEDDEPVERWTRTVKGACADEDGAVYAEYDEDDTGNATEDFVGCCYKTEWVDVGLQGVRIDGVLDKGLQKQERVVKNCTGGEDDDPDGIATTRNKAVCYVSDTWNEVGACGKYRWGLQKSTREVKNASLCTRNADTTTTKWEECCDQTDWREGSRCQTEGDFKGYYVKTREVSDACDGEDAKEVEKGDACCYVNKSGGTEAVDPDAPCANNGYREMQYTDTVGECSAYEKSAPSEGCCYIPKNADGTEKWGEAQPNEGAMCDDNNELEVVQRRTLVGGGNACKDVATERSRNIACNDCEGSWSGVGWEFQDYFCTSNRHGTKCYNDNYGSKFKFTIETPKSLGGRDCAYRDGQTRIDWTGKRCIHSNGPLEFYPNCPGATDIPDLPSDLA